jgi:hypothetical protein
MFARIKKPQSTETPINIVSKENNIDIDGEKYYFKKIFDHNSTEETVHNGLGKKSVEGIYFY